MFHKLYVLKHTVIIDGSATFLGCCKQNIVLTGPQQLDH